MIVTPFKAISREKTKSKTSLKSLLSATFGNIQFLTTKNQMQWKIADKVCAEEFNGSGYIHLAAYIPEGTRDYTLNTMENYTSVWLDNLAYDLGCRGNILEFFSFHFWK